MEVRINRNNKIIIECLQLEVFKILKMELHCSYCKKSGKEYFLKEDYPNYRIMSIYELRDDLIEYIENNFEKLCFNRPISLEQFLNVIYEKRPVTKKYARSYLGHFSRILENDYYIVDNSFIKFK